MSLKSKRDTSFREWIESMGIPKVSKVLNINHMTARHWLDGRTLPKAKHMMKIKKVTKGKISYEQIIEGSCSPIK
jgi:hypothetical protein